MAHILGGHQHHTFEDCLLSLAFAVPTAWPYLNEGCQNVGDIMLMGPDVLLQEGIEVEKDEAMHADHPRHSPHHGQPGLKPLVATLLQPCQQLLCKILQGIAPGEPSASLSLGNEQIYRQLKKSEYPDASAAENALPVNAAFPATSHSELIKQLPGI